jgi:site-specific DNA-methyltransferase (adenine-specific)
MIEEAKRYNVIYADPAWSYENKKTGGSMISGAEEKYYLITNSDIMQMPIKEITEKDAVCFLWATVPLMPEAFETLNAWGFQYKTMLTWRKIMSLGMGFWFRGQCEHLLLGVKGKVKPFRMQVSNFHQTKVGKHSQKPHYFRELISKAVANSFETPKKLELFARSREGFFPDYEYDGWDVWGNQVNNSIELPNSNSKVA